MGSRTALRTRSLLLFALAFGVRSIPAPRVFDLAAGTVHPFGTDAYYHLRRVLYTLERFPATLTFDPYIAFPFGGEPIWPPLFDWLLALVAWPVHRGASPEAARSVEALLVWVPPLLGALAVVGVYRLARRIFDEPIALASGAVLALLPAHTWYSRVGFVDHHAAVAALFVLLLQVGVRLLEAVEGDDARSERRAAAGLGATAAVLLLVWPGSLLHVGLIELFLIGTAALRGERETAVRQARALTIANTVAAALVAPFGLTTRWTLWSDFSPVVLSHFQPWLFGALALHAAGCMRVWGRGVPDLGDWGASRARRALAGAGLGASLLLASVSAFPSLAGGALDAGRWLLRDEAFQAVVAESRPLFHGAPGSDRFDASVAEARLSRLVYAVPLLLVWMFMKRERGARGRAVALVCLCVLAFGAVTLMQRRFFNSWSVTYALVLGFAIVSSWRLVAARRAGPGRIAAGTAWALALAWTFAPLQGSYQLSLRNVGEAIRGESLSLPAGLVRARRFRDAAEWLREGSPPTAGFLDASARPEYGVLALWNHGHLIEYLARRPSVADNFGDDVGETTFLASYRFFQAEESEARRLADDLRVRYVLLRTSTGRPLAKLRSGSMQRRLSGTAQQLDRLDWLDLVYDEPLALPGDRSRVRIFELRRPAGD